MMQETTYNLILKTYNGCLTLFRILKIMLSNMRAGRIIARSLIGFFIGLFISGGSNAQGISVEENYARNAPGIAMVQAVYSATVYANKVAVNEPTFNRLVDSVKRLDHGGGLSGEQKLDIVIRELYANPIRYFSPTTEYYTQQHRVLSNGTGFFITGEGHLITNCHVIERDSAFIRRKFLLSTFQEVTDANINALESAWQMTLSEEQRNLLYDVYSFVYSRMSPLVLNNLRKELNVLYRIDNGDEHMARIKKPAEVLIKGKAMPGKDVAILKINDVRNLPVLRISNSTQPRIGSSVLVLGFPEPAGNNVFLALDAATEPTLTSGVVSAVKKSVGGWPVIQMDALIAHGSSGSPVCDEKGDVIGLATFGSLEQRTGTLASGFNFAIPLPVIQEFIDSVKVKPRVSHASQVFNQGLQFFYQSYYRKALSKFKEVLNINGNYPGVHLLITECEKRMAAGGDRQSFIEKNFFRIIAFALVIGGVYIIYRQRRQLRVSKEMPS